MWTSLRVAGLGPLDDVTVDLDPAGRTRVFGASETGKSTLADALLWLLTGETASGKLDVDRIRQDRKAVEVVATTSRSTRIARSMTRSRSQRRSVGDVEHSSEESFAAALKQLAARVQVDGRSVSLARLLLVPFAWRELAAGNSRALRDLIAPSDPARVRALVAERLAVNGCAPLVDGEDLSPKAVEAARRDATRARDEAIGVARGRREARDALKTQAPPAPSKGDLTAARTTLSDSTPWDRYDAALVAHERASERHRIDVARHDEWAAQRDRLSAGVRDAEAALDDASGPYDDQLGGYEQDLATARRELAAQSVRIEDLRVDFGGTDRALQAAASAHLEAEEQLELAQASERDAEPCPTCGHEGFDWSAEVDRRKALLSDAHDAHIAARAAYDARIAAEKERIAQERADADATIARLRADAERLMGEIARLKPLSEARREAAAALHRERQRHSDHMLREPVICARPDDPPTPPAFERPTPDAVARARELLTSIAAAEAAAKQHAQAVEAATDAVTAAAAAEQRARAAHERAEVLVAGVREAPDALFARGVEAMGDLRDVRVRLVDGAVDVRAGAWAFDALSTGAQVRADAVFRAGLRRRFAMAWFPIVVDRVQDWTGDWDWPDPSILLVTEAGPLRVEALQPVAVAS